MRSSVGSLCWLIITTSSREPAGTDAKFGEDFFGRDQLSRAGFELGDAAKDLVIPRTLDLGGIFIFILKRLSHLPAPV